MKNYPEDTAVIYKHPNQNEYILQLNWLQQYLWSCLLVFEVFLRKLVCLNWVLIVVLSLYCCDISKHDPRNICWDEYFIPHHRELSQQSLWHYIGLQCQMSLAISFWINKCPTRDCQQVTVMLLSRELQQIGYFCRAEKRKPVRVKQWSSN